MNAVIDDLSSNKSRGLDERSAEYFKFAQSILTALMFTLIIAIFFVHELQ